MKKSEVVALVSVVVGAAVGFALWHWVTFLPGWFDTLIGAIAAAAWFQTTLRIESQKSIVNSKAINKP